MTALINMGNALASRGQVDEALACYQKVLAVAPGEVDVHNNIGLALAARGQPEEGWPIINSCWTSGPTMRWHITTWATPWLLWAAPRRPRPIIAMR